MRQISLMKKLKYLLIFTGPLFGAISFWFTGLWTWLLPVYAYLIIPFLELIIPPSTQNFNLKEEENALNSRFYDAILYSLVPIQYGLLLLFLIGISIQELQFYELFGRIVSFGVACVVLGINVAHELGHRANSRERMLSKALLLTSLYMHFIIEHNKGHHKHVGTPKDPATAKKGETLYLFWIRSITQSYFSAIRIEHKRLNSIGFKFLSIKNQMLHFLVFQIALVVIIYVFFDQQGIICFISAAGIGILFFETVNYLEHYGLTRQKKENGNYERVRPVHSWNSNHAIGRAILFEVTRHSDHHYMASRKYQILRNIEEAPQLPTGYPLMILCALIPPLWFFVMHKHMDKIKRDRKNVGEPITSIS